MRIDILTIFPEMFGGAEGDSAGPFSSGIIKRAIAAGRVAIHLHDIRDFATDRRRSVDDLPYGGGPGMVLRPEPLVTAIESVPRLEGAARVLLSPQGTQLTQAVARELSALPQIILVCGRYEGVDDRVRQGWIDRELSIGDYVMTGGELAAMVVVDVVARLVPGVVGNAASIDEESHAGGLLEYPQFTRPPSFRGMQVPPVLLSGDHGEIARWRRAQSVELTWRRRPDLLAHSTLSADDRRLLEQLDSAKTKE
ncbi:MAG: tRNA (guanosine(37)-N1)-methyltransferase TrmD [Deltaproteobacteria bacterium]|nr:tRNA (guanosine(37)-N1)-methyltransferase TrmD [Deltaproteobacteria bacterium]